MTRADGTGILITSDTSNFAFNISKAYPWETSAYSSSLSDRGETVLSIIAKQRGAQAGNIKDQTYYKTSSVIEPGMNYSFSYRIVPVTQSQDCLLYTSINIGI